MKKLLFIFFISLFLCSVVQAQAPLKRPERKAKTEKVQKVKPRKTKKSKPNTPAKPVKEVKVDTVVVLSKPDTVYLERKPDTVYMERIQVAESKPDTKSVSGTINGHDYVDLGLPSGLKWATMNVGASSPEDYGGYFAWGEVETKSEYTDDTYIYLKRKRSFAISRLEYLNIGKNISASAYDVANIAWGDSWRMPTKKELGELRDMCSWKWSDKNGVRGMIVTGPNGNTIFLPATGHMHGFYMERAGEYGSYWSDTLFERDNGDAYSLFFNNLGNRWDNDTSRYYGRTIRPVAD